MAFRKRNIAIAIAKAPNTTSAPSDSAAANTPRTIAGVRPSPLTSHPVTSTGTASLDGLLGGHSGLALGNSLLIEESGTTDFAGALLKYYAAEGICQGHVLHVVGLGEGWLRELPGKAEEKSKDKAAKSAADEEKMKIAWRYERLAQAGERALPHRTITPTPSTSAASEIPLNHTFDLTKRLAIPADAKVNHIPMSPSFTFSAIIQSVLRSLDTTPASTVHRLLVPSILSPAMYPPTMSRPEAFLAFFRALRSLLRQFPSRLTAIVTLPLELYSRSSGMVRWAEILSDGVIELTPFPHLMDASNSLVESGGARGNEEQPQGLVRFHKLPVNSERGEGGAGALNSMGEDLAFTLSRRKFVIKPFSLPPLEGDQEAQKDAGKVTAKDSALEAQISNEAKAIEKAFVTREDCARRPPQTYMTLAAEAPTSRIRDSATMSSDAASSRAGLTRLPQELYEVVYNLALTCDDDYINLGTTELLARHATTMSRAHTMLAFSRNSRADFAKRYYSNTIFVLSKGNAKFLYLYQWARKKGLEVEIAKERPWTGRGRLRAQR
ncbi:hypothetical protein AC578_10800 [Pseudocercospora eumusae]|uniref:Elongator complex protein 4 n=1 Tax=Pseudocercospora eumusae TaxID=321146 RepID=A0A139H3S6_9PEZI|nr:hypothetical protein AC578_10800 [Pseudocercospora eumusae]